jgi:hypothetical protein
MRGTILGKALLGGSAVLAVAALAVMLLPTSAEANGPTKYGWWYEANQGLPVPPPPPPQVPPDGLYVGNGFSGPTAISALTFTVPSGAGVGPLTLKIAGNPTITQPPSACTLSPASAGYKPAQEGAWSDRPSYECKKAQITGSVDANQTSVTFKVDPFLANGILSLVVLAGGAADQIAFQKPDDSALRITNGDTAAGAGGATYGGAGTDLQSSGGDASNLPSQPSSSANYSQPLVDTRAGGAPIGPTGPSAPGSPVPAAPSGGTGGARSPGYALGSPASVRVRQGWHTTAATALGLASALGALVAWTLGYGPLGGRIQPLSVRLRPPPPPPE